MTKSIELGVLAVDGTEKLTAGIPVRELPIARVYVLGTNPEFN
jgi:hypothetical protein